MNDKKIVSDEEKEFYKQYVANIINASDDEAMMFILEVKFHGFTKEHIAELVKNTFPFNEIPFAMEMYAQYKLSSEIATLKEQRDKAVEESDRLKKFIQHLSDSYSDEWTNAENERISKVLNGQNPF